MYDLKFSKIFSFQEFITHIPLEWKGVYVWGFRFPQKYEGKFLAYYVGRRFDSIRSRIILHHEKHIPYDTHNIFKKEYLPDFFKYIIHKKPVTDEEYDAYKNKFAFLNSDRNFKAINISKKTIKIQYPSDYKILAEHIDFYLENFYACCIPVNEVSKGWSIIDDRILIAQLERHIQALIPHPLATKRIFKLFNHFNIDDTQLVDEVFYGDKYKQRLGI
jgi:hypothetical protein